jgi:hypothetical protein
VPFELVETLAASQAERQDVYGWLFKTRHTRAQDVRLRIRIEQEAFLREHSCDETQGYYFNKPCASEAFEKLLREHVSK